MELPQVCSDALTSRPTRKIEHLPLGKSLFVSHRNDIEFGRAGRVHQVTCQGARQAKDATRSVVLGTAKLEQIRIRRAVVFVFIVNRV